MLTLSPGDLEKVRNYFKLKEDNILSSPLLKGLTRVGFKPFGDGFVSTRYPNMFAALCALANRCEKASGFPYFLFCNLEFRNITQKNWWPCVADYFEPLFASQRQTAEELHAFALEHKLRPEISTYWKVGYLYKGKKVMWLSSHDCRLGVNVLGTAAHEDHALINSRLEGESPEFQRQALIHVHRCDACATTHLGVFVWVLGKKQRVCGAGEIAFRWYHPDEKAIDIAKQLIRFRMQIIDELEQSKSEA